jgi:hypothetical protein
VSTLREFVAAVIGGASAAIYFCVILYLLVGPLTEDDTLAWIWAFGASAVITIVFFLAMVCIGLGYLTCRLVLADTDPRS